MPALEAVAIAECGKVVDFALSSIKSNIEEVLKKRAGLKDHVCTLQYHLHAIQSVIAENRKIIRSQSSTSPKLRNWTVGLRCFAYDMEDYIEGYRANTITGAKLYDKITELKKSVVEVNGFWEKLKEVQEELNQRSDEGGASSSISSRPTYSNPQRRPDDPGLLLADLAREEHLGRLLDLPARKLKVIVISVVGFGGTGKTNLCQQVYDRAVLGHNNGQDQFSRHAFVSAAGKDRNEVLGEIILRFLELESKEEGYDGNANAFTRFITNQLRSLTPLRIIGRLFKGQEISQDGIEGIENASIDVGHQVRQYISELAERLRDERYCIGIDDVGSEELGKLIASFFPENNMGSRIIMGMTVVGSKADSSNGPDNVSLNQFQNEAVEGGRHRFQIVKNSSSSASQSLMVMKCDGGEPLALVSVSEVLGGPFNADNIDEKWRLFRTGEAALLRQNMYLVLPHGYERLQRIQDVNLFNQYIPDIQACLLYFAMFPRGNHVKRGSLIRRWLAEGLELGSSNIDEATKKLQALIDRNFVWPLHVSTSEDQHVKACQPPEEMIPFITEMSKEENFIMMSCARAHTLDYIRRLSLHPTVIEGSGSRRNPTNNDDDLPQRLRTLAVSRRANVDRIIECKRLRVLDLEEYSCLQEELDKICNNLNLLKYLSLKVDRIEKVPSSISNLKWLETLDLGKDEVPVQVPIEVIELPRLKHLLGKFKLKPRSYGYEKIKNSRLQRLAGFVTSKGEGFLPRMDHMKNLWKVKIWFNTNSEADANRLKAHLPGAITNFLWDGTIDHTLSLCFEDGCPSPGNLLDCLANASGRLYSLNLSGKNLSKIPSNFVAKLTGITKLRLSGWATIKLDATFLNDLSRMNDLKYLKLDAVKIEGICDITQARNIQEKVVIETTHVTKVEHMSIVANSRLPVIEIKPTALQKLVSLHLISEDIDCPSANVICKARGQADAHLAKLKEVALNASVAPQTKKDWHQAAREHHNCPRLLFIEHPRPRRSG